jgi:hypothetical protein
VLVDGVRLASIRTYRADSSSNNLYCFPWTCLNSAHPLLNCLSTIGAQEALTNKTHRIINIFIVVVVCNGMSVCRQKKCSLEVKKIRLAIYLCCVHLVKLFCKDNVQIYHIILPEKRVGLH